MISALFGGLGTVIGALIASIAKRRQRKADTVALASRAVADVAGAIEDVIAPLREELQTANAEIRKLRLRVELLTREMKRHGVPVPN